MTPLKLFTDGGSRGNPGPAAGGYVITDASGKELAARGVFIGKATNNVAEYVGMVEGLRAAIEMGVTRIAVFSDSELMVRQINGIYKVKSELLRPYYDECMRLLGNFKEARIEHVLRDKNKRADELANKAMDARKDVSLEVSKPVDTRQAPLKLAVLISGGGRTLFNLLEFIRSGRLNATVDLVICSRLQITGYQKAIDAGLNVKVVRTRDYPSLEGFSSAIVAELDAVGVDLVVQAGWLCHWNIPESYRWRVMNIHPALLPSFGGKGMWGHHVHEAVLASGCKVSGCTVHFCTNEYDAGPIIAQRCCEVLPEDSADTLAERVFLEECVAYPAAIAAFAEKRIIINNSIAVVRRK